MEPEDVTFQLLREITDDFSEARKLGEGAFGVVYKGRTVNGEDVAVKKLKPIENLDLQNKQFHNEFYNLKLLSHPNIVQVLGYCYETEKIPMEYQGTPVLVEETHRALCLEYLDNGSLRGHLADEFSGLDWPIRYKIIKGICDGLKYIHDELEESMYHLDLKPDNVLLDKNMVPKIADFGLSKIFGDELIRTTKSPLGTVGYQPPEYIERGEISKKFDIFSLGVIIIMILSGHNGYSRLKDKSNEEFIDVVRKNWGIRLQAAWSGSSFDTYHHQVETCTKVALSCMEDDSQKRLDIVQVINMLNEMDTKIDKLSRKQCHETSSKMTNHSNKVRMIKEPKEITGGKQYLNSMASSTCKEVEFLDVPQTISDDRENLIVGRTEEKRKIIDSLLKSMTEITILPIYGIGGIGKTTIARLIYNDKNFESYFRVWVDVPMKFDLDNVGNSIHSQISEKEMQLNEMNFSKKILIVLDNLWEEDTFQLEDLKAKLDNLWEEDTFQLEDLKAKLNNDDSINTIVLVTTRSEQVASKICTNIKPYKIEFLTDDMCWEIIKQRSDFAAREDKEYLKDIGIEIAMKCRGVALAAKSIGFMLQSKKSYKWFEARDNDIWNGPILEDSALPDHVLSSLKLSYSYMSPCLKQCFTYCATIQKGRKIAKNDLICQWLSMGFIEPTKMHSVVQLGEKYITQLLGLSFLQHSVSPRTPGVYHKHVLLIMHDLVHDLAFSLLGDTILDQSKQGTGGSSCQFALLTDCSKPLESCMSSDASLRALRFLYCARAELHGAAFAPATSLRVLDLSECCIPKLPDSICQLKQLRYLNAPGITGRTIPNSITNLSKLNYLILRGSCLILELPKSIGKMEGLMHLDLSGCSGIKELPKSFSKLQNLVYLDLSCCSFDNSLLEALDGHTKLQYLDLRRCRFYNDKFQYKELKKVMQSLTDLRYLNSCGFIDEQCRGKAHSTIGVFFTLVSSLYNLEHLDLSQNECLQGLCNCLGRLKRLHTLDLSGCTKLSNVPEQIREIDSLKFLIMKNCYSIQNSSGVPQLNNSLLASSHFAVHTENNESSSNLGLLQNANPTYELKLSRLENVKSTKEAQIIQLKEKQTIVELTSHFAVHTENNESSSNLGLLQNANLTYELKLSRLENVKSTKEAQIIQLKEKQTIVELRFRWTKDAKRFLEDREVLRELVPPMTLDSFELGGYNSVSLPDWVFSIGTYLPNLIKLTMFELPKCTSLPPLGQLLNLRVLVIRRMDSLREIGKGFYGTKGAFPQLNELSLFELEKLEEWNTTYTDGEDGANESMFHALETLRIHNCPKLRLKPCPPRAKHWDIEKSDNVLSSWDERGQTCASSSSSRTYMKVKSSDVPLHQWRLLHHLPALNRVSMEHCSDMITCSPEIFRVLSTLQYVSLRYIDGPELPEWLTELTVLKELDIRDCKDVKSLPENIQKLNKLKEVNICACPELKRWCAVEENKKKLAHINIVVLDYTSKVYRVYLDGFIM